MCVCDRGRLYRLNQLTDLIQMRYLGSSRKYLEQFLSFASTPKIKRNSNMKKISVFLKMASTILIKFCGQIVHSKPNNMISAFVEKSLKLEKYFFKFF